MGYIYRIYCDIPDIKSSYIGKTNRTVEERFKEHISDALNQKRNFKLHNAIRKYGLEHFHYEILGEYEEKDLNEKEQYWIEYYNSYYDGWNSTFGGDGNVQWTEEMKQQQSEIMKEYYKNNPVSKETKEKLSQKLIERWSDPEYKEKLKQSQLKSYQDHPERREQQRLNNIKRFEDPLERLKSSEAQKKRWSNPEEHKKASKSHIKSHGKKIKCIETGIEYDCIADACEALGKKRTASGISEFLRGNKKSAYGYHWQLIEKETNDFNS